MIVDFGENIFKEPSALSFWKYHCVDFQSDFLKTDSPYDWISNSIWINVSLCRLNIVDWISCEDCIFYASDYADLPDIDDNIRPVKLEWCHKPFEKEIDCSNNINARYDETCMNSEYIRDCDYYTPIGSDVEDVIMCEDGSIEGLLFKDKLGRLNVCDRIWVIRDYERREK